MVFQADIGEGCTYDFYNGDAPVLHVTTTVGTYEIDADHSSLYAQVDNGEVYMNFQWEDLYINSYAFQFDLSALPGDVTSFSVEFHGVQHAQLYGLGLQQSDVTETESGLPESVD